MEAHLFALLCARIAGFCFFFWQRLKLHLSAHSVEVFYSGLWVKIQTGAARSLADTHSPVIARTPNRNRLFYLGSLVGNSIQPCLKNNMLDQRGQNSISHNLL